MEVLRGRASTPEADRTVMADRLELASKTGESTVRVWHPHPVVAFGRRDSNAPEYETARMMARDAGYTVIDRHVGGRAVAHTGKTLAFAVFVPSDESTARSGITDRYALVRDVIRDALGSLGATVISGEPDGSFCPGTYSLRVTGGGKCVGIAQRVRLDAVLIAGIIVVTDQDATAVRSVLQSVYRLFDVPFDSASVGSVEAAGGPGDSIQVRETVESALVDVDWGRVGSRDPTFVSLGDIE